MPECWQHDLAAVAIVFCNMLGSVLLTWIRAKYRWRNGSAASSTDEPPHG